MENYNETLVDTIASRLPPNIINQISTLTQKDFEVVLEKASEQQQKLEEENYFHCNECNKSFRTRAHFRRHQKIHDNERYSCEHCDKTFNRKDNLNLHMRRKHFISKRKSNQNNDKTSNIKKVKRNENIGSTSKFNSDVNISTTSKPNTDENIASTSKSNSDVNISTTSKPNTDENIASTSKPYQDTSVNDEMFCVPETTALDKNMVKKEIAPSSDEERYDLITFFKERKTLIIQLLKDEFESKQAIKWYFSLHVRMVKYDADGTYQEAFPHFNSNCTSMLKSDEDIEHNVNQSFQKVYQSFEEYIRMGSGWMLENVLHLDIYITTYKPLYGSSYIDLPTTLRYSNSLLNIQNNDNRCFVWCILAWLYPVDRDSTSVNHYLPYYNELNLKDIDMPTPLSQVSKFESQNNISTNVFGFEEGEIYPLHITKKVKTPHVNLLYIKEGEKQHYVLIKDFNRFLSRSKKHKNPHYFCYNCLNGFPSQHSLDKHIEDCQNFKFQKISLPPESECLEFNDFKKTQKMPFVIYADFECLTKKTNIKSSTSTTKYQRFEPYSFGYKRVCIDERYTKEPVIYTGDNVVETFFEYLFKEEEEIKNILSKITPMELTEYDKLDFKEATTCYVCKKPFSQKNHKVIDHDHLTGEVRGVACNRCNLQMKTPKFIPIVFHNLKGFDGSILMSKIGKYKDRNITVIPHTSEKYLSFTLGHLRFLDSLQFLNSSLSDLADNLAKDGETHFKCLSDGFQDPHVLSLLLRKGVFPYDYVDDIDKLEERQLPSQDDFYNKLTNEHISNDDYEFAKTVWNTLNVQTLREYSDIYLKMDVCILADVFERFRDICHDDYGLEPLWYYSLPGYSWSAMFKKTKVVLDCVTDVEKLLFLERGIRGGVSGIFHRYAKANNAYIPETYDPNLPSNFLTYLDVNNLYGWSMSQPLPYGYFTWLQDDEIERLDIEAIKPDGKIGYIFEVDLEYPKELHDQHADFPLAPEKKTITTEDLSPYSKRVLRNLNNNKLQLPKVKKLIPNLYDKEKYVLHYRNLQLYLKLGLKLKKIHRVLQFKQSCWLKEFIDFNTEKRKLAKTEFEKNLYKLFNNAVYGKTLQNVRKYVDIKLCHTKKKLFKYTAKPSFENCKIFCEDLVAIQNKRVNVLMNQPVYVGFSILELSKLLMYEFHYLHMKKIYGNNITLCFSDTDSFLYSIHTKDIYRDMEKYKHLYDTSDYPPTHVLYDEANKKVLGKMKDETKGNPITEFIGLRSKMYSITMCKEDKKTNSTEKHTAKGISYNASKHLKHEMYKECLFDEQVFHCNMNIIRGEKHVLYAQSIRKKGLVPYDDKRFILNDGISTRPYGHKDNL